jgi:hypothetical protein
MKYVVYILIILLFAAKLWAIYGRLSVDAQDSEYEGCGEAALLTLRADCGDLLFVAEVSDGLLFVAKEGEQAAADWGRYTDTINTSHDDGISNTKAISSFWADSAAKLCEQRGDGWFLPAVNQLLLIYEVSRIPEARKYFPKDHTYYWSSSAENFPQPTPSGFREKFPSDPAYAIAFGHFDEVNELMTCLNDCSSQEVAESFCEIVCRDNLRTRSQRFGKPKALPRHEQLSVRCAFMPLQ